MNRSKLNGLSRKNILELFLNQSHQLRQITRQTSGRFHNDDSNPHYRLQLTCEAPLLEIFYVFCV